MYNTWADVIMSFAVIPAKKKYVSVFFRREVVEVVNK